jgi:5-methylcytosine-specific restriction endonuclease McrA
MNFVVAKGSAIRCVACRKIKRAQESKTYYRSLFTDYDGSTRHCIQCGTDITHHKLDRASCDNCRPRDCSYLKHMKTLLEKHKYTCVYCGIKVCRAVPPTIDHKIPLSRGGTNVLDNLTIACRSCNARKGTKTYLEFQAEAE